MKGDKTAAVWNSDQLYRLIVESARDFAIFTVDTEKHITTWNRGAKRILGYSEAEALGLSADEIFVPEDRRKNAPAQEMLTARADGRAIDERWHLRKNGTRFWGSGLMMRMDAPNGQVVGYLKILRDLTDRKKSQDALIQLNQTLEDRVQARTAELEASHKKLRALAQQLSRTERLERERIAADLHDHLGQILALAQMKVSSIASSVAVDETVAETARELREYLDEAVKHTRALMTSLSPPVLRKGDLAGALKWLAADMAKHGLKASLRTDRKRKPVSPDLQAAVFQAVRELLYNVLKHSGVQKATVKVERADDVVCVVVEDGGIGFQKRRLSAEADARSGFGLFSVSERLRLYGGQLEVDMKRKKGTRVVITAPIDTVLGNTAGKR